MLSGRVSLKLIAMNVPGRHLDRQPCAAFPGKSHRFTPANLLGHVGGEIGADFRRFGHRSRHAAAQIGQPGTLEFDRVEFTCELRRRGCQQCAMRRHRDADAIRGPCTRFERDCSGLCQGGIAAGDHHLGLRVEIREVHRCCLAMDLGDDTLHRALVEPRDRHHAVARWESVLHECAAPPHEAHRIVELQNAGRHGGRIRTDREPRHHIRRAADRLDQTCSRHAGNQQAELDGDGRRQRGLGVEFDDAVSEHGARLVECLAHDRGIGQRAKHLRTL
jgi:hypothetical protein